jgi:uncharacterized protein (TIGR02217 family)
MTTFAEVRLEAGLIIYNTKGGSAFSTNVIVMESGFEQRSQNWQNSRGRWEFGLRKADGNDTRSLNGFFRLRRGRFQGFRLKDWGNYTATHLPKTERNVVTQGVINLISGSTTVGQMYKKTTDLTGTSDIDLQRIAKPITSVAPAVYKDDTLLTEVTDWEVDLSTGLVTFVVPPSASVLTWEGQFDMPVRFDVDEFMPTLTSGTPTMTEPPDLSDVFFELPSLAIVEIRVP